MKQTQQTASILYYCVSKTWVKTELVLPMHVFLVEVFTIKIFIDEI